MFLKDRTLNFTDSVLSIIMTILVLQLPTPETPSLQGLLDLGENYFAYALSFFWIGAMWINLNKIWRPIKNVSNSVLWWTIVMLFFASLIPNVTNYAGSNFYNQFAQLYYGVIVMCVTISNFILTICLRKVNTEDKETVEMIKAYDKAMKRDILLKVLGLVSAFFTFPPLCMFYIILATFFPTFSLNLRFNPKTRRFERRKRHKF